MKNLFKTHWYYLVMYFTGLGLADAGLKLVAIILPQPSRYRDYRCKTPCLVILAIIYTYVDITVEKLEIIILSKKPPNSGLYITSNTVFFKFQYDLILRVFMCLGICKYTKEPVEVRRGIRSPGTWVVSCHMDTGNWSWVLCNGSKHS